MLNRVLCYIAIIITALHTSSYLVAASYSGFIQVEDDKCVVLQDKDLKGLPANWQKYKGFVKTCELKQNKASKPIVSLISVWSSGDYHYAPLLWDDRDNKYRILNSERISGKRSRRGSGLPQPAPDI